MARAPHLDTPTLAKHSDAPAAAEPSHSDEAPSSDGLHSGSGGGPTAAAVKEASANVSATAGFGPVPPLDPADEALAIATAEAVSSVLLNSPAQPGDIGYTVLAPTSPRFPTSPGVAHDGRTVTGHDVVLVRTADGGIEPVSRGEGLPATVADGEEARLDRLGVFGPHPTKPALA